MKDFLGQTIKVGDVLVYPVRRRSDMWLQKAQVLGFDQGQIKAMREDTVRVTLKHPETTIIVGDV